MVQRLFPISDVLERWHHASPRDWGLGGDALAEATEWWRCTQLVLPTRAIGCHRRAAFNRRDVTAA